MAEDVVYAEAANPGLGAAHPAAAQLRVRIILTAMVESYLTRAVALLQQKYKVSRIWRISIARDIKYLYSKIVYSKSSDAPSVKICRLAGFGI